MYHKTRSTNDKSIREKIKALERQIKGFIMSKEIAKVIKENNVNEKDIKKIVDIYMSIKESVVTLENFMEAYKKL
nr:MAG TPA: calmodulin [Caudoviricetes sp.]